MRICSGNSLAAVCFAASIAVGASTSASAMSITDRYTSFWVLGDSLSDPGNFSQASGGVIPGPPYFEGRFSNGPVWADMLAQQYADAGRPVGNLAFGGAKAAPSATPGPFPIPDLPMQNELFLSAAPGLFGDSPLVTLWFGGNDILEASQVADAAVRRQLMVDAADAIFENALKIGEAGATDFMIFDLGDVGRTPRFVLFDPDNRQNASDASAEFDKLLRNRVSKLREAGYRVIDVDFSGLLDRVANDPAAFGFNDPVTPCLFPNQDLATAFGQALVCSQDEEDERVFFDSVHLNTRVHELIADEARAAISAVPLPATLPLLIAALGGVAALRMRRRG